MLNDRIDQQTIALAGLYQSCRSVSKVAWNGEYKEEEFIPLINCILQINSTDTENIYISIASLQAGLIYLRRQILGDIFTRSSETRRYITSISQLSNNLMADNECIQKLQTLLKEMDGRANSMTVDEKIIELSDIYQKTLSMFEPRIIINGDNKYLTDKLHASRIRTALFAGVRSMILWEQLGGSKLKLFFLKRKFSRQIDAYLDNIRN
tara:strand:+ start:301 stop:927 length:627 start_codon:yes stop_codon:yes gene_type:complete